MNKISIIMPVYNQKPWFVQQAINSCLNQILPKHYELEIVIVDDGSTNKWYEQVDLTHPCIKFYRYEENKGGGHGIWYAAQKATGNYLAALSSDDYFFQDKLEIQLAFMDYHKVGFSYTAYREDFLDDNDNIVFIREHGVKNFPKFSGKLAFDELIKNDFGNNFINGASILVQRDIYEQSGGYDFTLISQPDYDLWLRITSISNIIGIEHCLMVRRIHNNQSDNLFNHAPDRKLSFLKTKEYIKIKLKWRPTIYPVTKPGIDMEVLKQLGY